MQLNQGGKTSLPVLPYLPLCFLILMFFEVWKFHEGVVWSRSIIKKNAKFRCKHLKLLKTVKNTGNIVFLFHDLFPWFIHPAKTISILSWYFLSSKLKQKQIYGSNIIKIFSRFILTLFYVQTLIYTVR